MLRPYCARMPRRAPLPYADFDPTRCLNCGATFLAETRFCPRCGQPNRTHKRSLADWLTEGLSSFFHFEGRIWNTLRDLYVPGRVARNYLNGQRQRYVHPLRLLLFSSLLLLLCVQLTDVDGEDGSEVQFSTDANQGGPEGFGGAPAVKQPFGVPDEDAFTAQMRSIDVLRMRLSTHDRLRAIADSARAGGLATAPQSARLLDTLLVAFGEPSDTLLNGEVFGTSLALDNRKLAALSTAEAVEQSGVEDWWGRLALAKAIDVIHEGEESINAYLLSTLSWGILFYVPLLALGYYGLYWRRLPYYTQHLSVVATGAGALLLAGSLALTSTIWFEYPGWLVTLLVGAAAAYVLVNDWRVYEYAWWKTLLKGLLLTVYGSVAIVLAVALWLGLALLLR